MRLPLWPLTVVLAAGVLAWNGARFVHTKQQPRVKDLDFLPSPAVARALALGQPTAVAKLRWIDSFAYFQLQLDRQDDRVAGAGHGGGFERLYDTLISLDPLFLPFYQHAVTNTGGVLKQHRLALGYVLRGLLASPRESGLWRLASAELAVNFDWVGRNPVALDRWLATWEESESDEAGRQLVRDWRRGLAFTRIKGLETLPYWLEQLHSTRPGSPLGDYIEGTIRELLAQHGTIVLSEVAAADWMLSGTLILDRAAVARRWPQGPPSWAPVAADGSLRPDPYGWPWQRQDAEIISPGWQQVRFRKQCQGLRLQVQAEADQRGRSPRDLAEARAWGIALPDAPLGGTWDFSGHLPDIRWPDPPHEPWKLR